MAKNRRNLNDLYPSPIPIDIIRLPELVPHNPVSWVYFVWTFLSKTSEVQNFACCFEDGQFKVKTETDMVMLWRMGFFGKGKLSRSDPTWYVRTNRRLGLNVDERLTNEEITELRRFERKIFKTERSKLQSKELELKTENKIAELDNLEQEKANLKTYREGTKFDELKHILVKTGRFEDESIIDSTGQLVQLEYLQLMPVEVFFLKFAFDNVNLSLDSKSLSINQLFDLNIGSNVSSDNKFILDYVVYHHFRSLGWCVRSGIKFGVDFLLYKRGPPFIHAEYSICVIPNYQDEDRNRNHNWIDDSSILRVIGGVKKTLVYVYVDIPSERAFNECISKGDLVGLFGLYKVTEVLYRRWVASKNRD